MDCALNVTRLVLVTAALVVGGSTVVQAQTETTTFSVTSIILQEPVLDDRALTQQELDSQFFNLARCECGEELNVRINITPDLTNTSSQLIFASGSNCLSDEQGFKDTVCRILEQEKVNQWNAQQNIHESISDIMTTPDQECATAGASTTNLTVYISVAGDNSYAQAAGAKPNLPLGIDTAPPPAPIATDEPVGGDGQVTVYFDLATRDSNSDDDADGGTSAPSTRDPDIDRSQILCEILGDNDTWYAPNIDQGLALYVTQSSLYAEDKALCPNISDDNKEAFATREVTLPAEDGVSGAIVVLDVAGGVETLHPAFACSEATTATTGSMTVPGLINNRTYRFWALSMDKARNPSKLVALGTATPGPSEDLWERYKRSGGTAEGCTVGLHGREFSVLGLLLLALGLWRARRLRDRS